MAHDDWVLDRYNRPIGDYSSDGFQFQNGGQFVDISESQIEQFCSIFSYNDQCNFTKTISHLRLCKYRDSHLDFVSVTIRQIHVAFGD